MPVPLVVVELPAADVGTPQTAALLEACSKALGSGRCVTTEEGDDDNAAVAVVSWSGEGHERAVVEVGRRRDARRAFRSREIVFQTNDEPSERFRTVGFTIASLAGEIERRDAAPPPPATPEVAAARPARPTVREPVPGRRSFGFSIGMITGPGLDTGMNRLGILARANYWPSRLPLFATISIHYALRARDNRGVAVSWLAPGLGGGATATLPLDFALRAHIEGIYERVTADAEDALADRSERADRWVLGGRAGLDLVWPERGPVGAMLLFDFEKLAGKTTINAFGSRVGTAEPSHYDFGVALEVRLGK